MLSNIFNSKIFTIAHRISNRGDKRTQTIENRKLTIKKIKVIQEKYKLCKIFIFPYLFLISISFFELFSTISFIVLFSTLLKLS